MTHEWRPLPALLHFQHKPTCEKSISRVPPRTKTRVGSAPPGKSEKKAGPTSHSLSQVFFVSSVFVHVGGIRRKSVVWIKGTSGLRWPPSSQSAASTTTVDLRKTPCTGSLWRSRGCFLTAFFWPCLVSFYIPSCLSQRNGLFPASQLIWTALTSIRLTIFVTFQPFEEDNWKNNVSEC